MKKYIALTLAILLFGVYASTFVFAESTLSNPSICCEKTTDGAYCINTDAANCDTDYKSSPTSCETTSYCKLGTCYDSEEGICMENTPQRVCAESGGTWDPREVQEVPQCQLGCCIIGDQAAFVPLVRCKRLSTFFGVENNYDRTITSETECIATAQSQDMGACVYEKDFDRVCEFTTRADCAAEQEVLTVNETVESNKRTFYDGLLCSAEELNTACARQTSTACYQGKVYWLDSCGNRENVYSSNREVSWNNGKVAEPEEVCDPNDGTNKNCGNCDYLLGSRCAEWDGLLGIGKPDGSDYFCQRTECTDRNGGTRVNGESWCVYDSETGLGKDKVGSRYYREVCVDGEVRVEPCDDFRNEVCLEGSIETEQGEFGTAGCRANRWQDCTFQTERDDCLNADKRDCMWLPPVTGLDITSSTSGEDSRTTGFSNPTSGSSNSFTNPTATGAVTAPITGNAVTGEGSDTETTTNREDGICVPNSPPGLNFWDDTNSAAVCGQATAACAVVYEEDLLGLGGKKVVAGKECLEESWALAANRVCTSLGDCGGYVNYNDIYTDDGYTWTVDDEEKTFTPNTVNIVKGGFNAQVIKELMKDR